MSRAPDDNAPGGSEASVANQEQIASAQDTTTERELVQGEFLASKNEFDRATVGLLAGVPFSEERCDSALRRLNAALAELARLGEMGR